MATAAEKAAAKAAKAEAEAAAKAAGNPETTESANSGTSTDENAPPVIKLPDVMPEKVKVTSFYGFYGDDGSPNFWQEGQVVTDPDQILILFERGAPLENIEE